MVVIFILLTYRIFQMDIPRNEHVQVVFESTICEEAITSTDFNSCCEHIHEHD